MAQTIFLTGANGHIGANTARELVKQGYQVVAFVREGADLRGLNGLDITLRTGDLNDADSMIAGARGCDAIIHTAAVYRMWAPKDADIIEPTLHGARNIIAAARANGIPRIVFTSSVAAVGWSKSQGEVRNETDWNDDAVHPYYIAKTESERLAHQLAAEANIELVVINPSTVVGPYDYKPTPSNGLIATYMEGKGQLYDGTAAYVHVADVARLHVDALTRGTPGERYIADAVSADHADIRALAESLFDTSIQWIAIPRPIGLALGYIQGLLSRITGRPPVFDHRTFLDYIARRGIFDNSRSIDTFGIEYRSLETMFADTAAWLIHAGMVAPETQERLRAKFPPKDEWL